MSNLQIVSQSKEADADRNNWKILFLGFLGFCASFGVSYFFDILLENPSLSRLIIFGFFMIVGVVFLLIPAFFVKTEWKLYLIGFASTLAATLPFFDRWNEKIGFIIFFGALLLFAFFCIGLRSGVQSIENSLKVKFFLIGKSITPKIVNGFLLFLSIIFFGNYFLWGRFTEDLGKTVWHESLLGGEPILKLWYSEADFAQPLDQFFETIARSQLRKTKFKLSASEDNEIDFSRLNIEVQSLLVKQTAGEMFKYAESRLGPLDPYMTVEEVGYSSIRNFWDTLSSKTKLAGGVILAFLVFITLKGIAGLLYWLIHSIAFILFKLLIVLGFAFTSLETKTREFVLLK